MFNFGKNLKNLRKNAGLTQKQVAEGINTSERNYQHYEANTRKPMYDSMIALADFFDISLDELAGRDHKPKS